MTAGLDFGALMNASALLFSAFGLALVFLARDIDDWPKGLSVAILSSAAVLSALELLDHAVAKSSPRCRVLSAEAAKYDKKSEFRDMPYMRIIQKPRSRKSENARKSSGNNYRRHFAW